MLRFEYTGRGLMTLWFVIFAVPISFGVGMLASGYSTAGALIVGSLCFAFLAQIHGFIARGLNSERTPHGRVWHNRHTLNGAPIQNITWVLVFAAGIGVMIGLWMISWLAAVGGVVAVLILTIAGSSYVENLRQQNGLGDRRELADTRGWRFRRKDTALASRLKAAHGKAALRAIPFGVVAGEIDDLPFTSFDTEFPSIVSTRPGTERTRRTMWMVHLPVALPEIEVVVGTHPDGSPRQTGIFDKIPGRFWDDVPLPFDGNQLRAVTDDLAYGNALLTPQVRRVTEQYQLDKWRIVGRDLMWASERPGNTAPLAAAALADGAQHLVALARALPSSVVEQYGTTPKTGVPFRTPTRAGGRDRP